ncbi:MmcQ/YjbR family DNA-binding protein [Aeromicrobium sp. CF3.5]|uniref:MmcQ/YjbR family DNA-binding protein n=1 Tax=Aeromicrobium sp. CF3.5 TaxID=3373078 RepID=UPI003EE45F50
MTVTWEELAALARTLPETTESTSYGTPALKVKGKLIARLRTDADGSLALRCSLDEKQALVADPDPAFFTTAHYDGHGYVLVGLEQADAEQVRELLDAAWWLVAPARVRQARERST